ncbi:YdaS family helix-turn-helix protein [Marinobacter sp. M1N3S26]|uniref:YdaS family helix-turn-helix protein n=1 Tax=Marinobacter sp. M1N3S26 TaxID=3382299 RepID=UPI00387B8E79
MNVAPISLPDVNVIFHRLKQHPEIRTKTRIAEICGVSPQSLNCWTRIPAEYVRRLEHASGGSVTRYEMRPDVFGPGPDDDSDLDQVMTNRCVA